MTKQQFKEGDSIIKEIDNLKMIVNKLEEDDSYFKVMCGSYNQHYEVPLDVSLSNTLYAVTLEHLNSKIKDLEEQFKQL